MPENSEKTMALVCPKCGCEDATLVIYPGTFALPECKVWHCDNCDEPLTQPE